MKEKKKLTGYASLDRPWEAGYSYFKKNPIVPGLSIYSLLSLLCAGKRGRTAIDCKELTVSYKKMLSDAEVVSTALAALGVKSGDIVAICMPNVYQAVVPFLACNRMGAVATFLNPGMPDGEIAEYLKQFHSPVLFNYEKKEAENAAILRSAPVNYIITLRKEKQNALELNEECGSYRRTRQLSFHCLGTLAKGQRRPCQHIFSGKETALILYTSGSTGQPKSVVLTNENVIAALMYADNTSNWKALGISRILVCVPFAYPYGLVTSLLSALFSGSIAILAPDIGKNTVGYYYSKKPEMVFGSPALLDLTIRGIPKGQDLSSVRSFISGGDFLTKSHAEEGNQFFSDHNSNIEIGNGAGNAETVSIATTPAGVKSKPETVGKVLVGSSAIVIDQKTLQEKRYGEEGMLCIGGKHVFKEYYQEPKLTAEAKILFNGKTYFKTGALGFLDEDGYFTLTGRASRFYIRSSLDKIYLDHVQGLISRFDCVYDCAVVKVPDDECLFVNYAFVVLKDAWPGTAETRAHIFELCRQPVVLADGKQDQLKDFEIPAQIIFLKELPRRSGTDKINYQALEQRAREHIV